MSYLHFFFAFCLSCSVLLLYAACLKPPRQGLKEIKMDDKNKGIHRKKYLLSSLRRIQIRFLQGGSSEESSFYWNLWDPGRVLCVCVCFCFAFFWTRGRKTVGVFYFGSYLYCWVLFIISIFLPLSFCPISELFFGILVIRIHYNLWWDPEGLFPTWCVWNSGRLLPSFGFELLVYTKKIESYSLRLVR